MKTKTQLQHTPTPWAIEHGYLTNGKNIPIEVHEGAVSNHADVDPEVKAQVRADAAFIVKAVNCHEELLEALKKIARYNGSTGGLRGLVDEIHSIANEAIAKAEGSSTI